MATTSGLIQRLKWAPGARCVFVYIGPDATSVRLMLVLFSDADAVLRAHQRAIVAVLAKAHLNGLAVSLFHERYQSLIDGVDVRRANIRVDAFEITQSIQTLSHTVPLLADKRTVVRVFLSTTRPAAIAVRGSLRLRWSGGGSTLIASNADVVLDSAEFNQTRIKRDNAAKTLNFVLPAGVATLGAFDVTLERIEAAATGAPQNFSPPGAGLPATFAASPPLRVTVIGFTYAQGAPPQTFTPTALDFDLLRSWLGRAYPAGNVIWSQRIVTANAAAPFGCGDINSQLSAIRTLDVSGGTDARTHYYGLVSDGGFFMRGCAGVPSSPNPAAVGSGPTGTGTWGWDFDGSYGDWYGGHELGHTYGRLHPGFCGETADDLANYPFVNGQLSNADGNFGGFDVGDPALGLPLAALPGVQWHDVMTYCNRQWLSSYTYLGIRQRLTAEDALAPGASPGSGRPDERFVGPQSAKGVTAAAVRRRLVQVIGRVNLPKAWAAIDYLIPIDRGEPAAPESSTEVVLQLLSGRGKVLEKVPVPLIPVEDEGQTKDRWAMLNTVLLVPAGAERIELLIRDRVAAEFRRGQDPRPIKAITAHRQRQGVELTWHDELPEQSGVTYSVQVSDDAGRTWTTMAVGVQTPSVTIHAPSRAPIVRVRIIGSNGFDAVTSEADLDGSLFAEPDEGSAE
jgi:hypothetical protein